MNQASASLKLSHTRNIMIGERESDAVNPKACTFSLHTQQGHINAPRERCPLTPPPYNSFQVFGELASGTRSSIVPVDKYCEVTALVGLNGYETAVNIEATALAYAVEILPSRTTPPIDICRCAIGISGCHRKRNGKIPAKHSANRSK